MTNNKEKKEYNKKGFTLVETLVAIFILVVAVTGPMSVAQSSLKASFLARDTITAHYLAQDSIEVIKSLMSDKMVKQSSFGRGDLGTSPCIKSPNVICEIDSTQLNGIKDCNTKNSKDCLLGIDNYQYVFGDKSSADPSKFQRGWRIDEVVPDKELKITVEVKWTSNFLTERKIVVQENIYNWWPAN